MIIVMEPEATEEQIAKVVKKLEENETYAIKLNEFVEICEKYNISKDDELIISNFVSSSQLSKNATKIASCVNKITSFFARYLLR